MSKEEIIQLVSNMKYEASKKVEQFKHADTDDEFSELNYYHGQKVALNKVLSWLHSLSPTNKE
jgi:hypothetical protein